MAKDIKPINIDGLSQQEIELKFSGREAKDMLRTEYEIFFSCDGRAEQIDTDLMAKILHTEDTEIVNNVFIYILSLIGNADIGIQYDKRHGSLNRLEQDEKPIVIDGVFQYGYIRDINVNNIITALSKSKEITNLYKSGAQCANVAMDIVAQFDGVLWDLHQKRQMHDNHWHTITYVRVGLHWKEEVTLKALYTQFRLPLIEKPIDWKVGQQGGYHVDRANVTTNRGHNHQPQQVLDVLNKLQSQSFILANHVDDLEEYHIVYKKVKDKAIKECKFRTDLMLHEIAQNICQSTRATYEALRDKEFYFEWKFGANGRMYNTGYDIHLQGSSYKKGSLIRRFN